MGQFPPARRELDLALRARARRAELAGQIKGLGFRQDAIVEPRQVPRTVG